VDSPRLGSHTKKRFSPDMIFLMMLASPMRGKRLENINVFGNTKINWSRQTRPFAEGIHTLYSLRSNIGSISSVNMMEKTFFRKTRRNKPEHIKDN
jgi:hypothetical protein